MKKKIIFVTRALWIGGIETALVNMLKCFDYDKYDVTLLIAEADLTMKEQIPSDCKVIIADREKCYDFKNKYKHSKLFHLTEKSTNPSFLHRMMMWTVPIVKWIENRLYISYIKKNMSDVKYDTAIIYSDMVGELTVRAIKADKYLMFYHHGAMRRVYHDEIAYKKSEAVIAVSENLSEQLKAFVPAYADKIKVVHNVTDVEGICEKAKEPINDNFDETLFNMVSVGRVSHEKGMDIAIKTCAKLINEGFTQVRWWIVGDGPAMQEVKQVIADTHMENYVHTVGMKTNPYPYIKQADLYVQPSRYESFGLTIMEALILGKQVVATDTLGAKEILSENNANTICPANENDLAELIKYNIHNSVSNSGLSKEYFIQKNKEIIKQFEKLI